MLNGEVRNSGTTVDKACLEEGTKVEAVYEKIKEGILSGNLKPGEQISTNKFARRFGVARNAVREAITRLRVEGLVRTEGAYSRTYVEEADLPSAILRYEVRECVEGMAARLAANNMNVYQVRELRHLAEECGHQSVSGHKDEADKANLGFHRYLVANCGNSLLLRIYELLHLAPVSVHLKKAGRVSIGLVAGVPITEYQESICDAIASRDGDQAEALIRERIRIITGQMRQVLLKSPSET